MGPVLRSPPGVLRPHHRSDPRRGGVAGSAAVEFALVLPLVALVIAGLVQVVRLGGESLSVLSAAREGARTAAVTIDDGEVRRAVIASGLDEARADILVERGGGVGTAVTVSLSYRAPAGPPILSWLLPTEVTLRARATMRQEVG
ncbi:MAG TPA: TadE family protein [Actinomycetota bacterium]